MQKTTERGRANWAFVWAWARDLILSLILAALVILFIYQPVQVEGTSMMPALVDQERIFISKLTYRFGIERIQRGDTVVFWSPADPGKSYIKRVIGVPGDVVRIDEGVVYVNGRRLEESYVPPDYRDHVSMAGLRIGPDYYFVLGDHRSSSNDSRHWGPVPRRSVYGNAVFIYWPPEKIGPVH
jgi:signal peptidase I